MQSLQTRIDSFQKTRRVRRYPGKPSSSTAAIKWPHPDHFNANPNTLAEAGFFFSPSWHDRDSVQCFLCGKELSDWDADDDPFQIHYSKCRNSCPWALLRCGLAVDLDDDGRFVFADKSRLPSTKAMEKARLQTFGTDWWPHDHPAITKMAQAGFVYTPQAAGDDTVTCLYCNLSLGGWEDGDDPINEHRTRDSNCPFLALSPKPTRSTRKPPTEQPLEDEQPSLDPPPPRAKRGKARSTTSAPRRKTRAARSKSTKAAAAAPAPPRSPSPAPMTVDEPVPDNNSPLPPSDDLPSPPAPSPPRKLSTPPPVPDPVVSLSPAGQPMVTQSKSLTTDERAMSLEQWIRHEINLGYEKLLSDGQGQIELFKTKAAELRKCIDEL